MSHGVHPDLMVTDGPPFGRAIPKAACDLAKMFWEGYPSHSALLTQIYSPSPLHPFHPHPPWPSSGPPSLELITELESGYEASVS